MVETEYDKQTPTDDATQAEVQFVTSQSHSGLLRTSNPDRTVDNSVNSSPHEPTAITEGSPDRPQQFWEHKIAIMPILGSILTLLGLGIGLLVGFDIFEPRSHPIVSIVRGVVAIGYVATGILGTLWIHDDARLLNKVNAIWQPNPYLYIGAGAVGVGAVITWGFRSSLALTPETVPIFAGIAILSVCLASVIVGPLYLFQRYVNLNWR